MKKLLLLALILSAGAFASSTLNSEASYKVNRKDKLNRDLSIGSWMAGGGTMRAIYDSRNTGATGTSQDYTLLDDEGNPVKLKAGTVITSCFVDVSAPLTSTHSGSLNLGLSSNAVGDLVTQALVGVNNKFTASGRFACTPVQQTISTYVKMASEATVKLRVGSEAISGGRFDVFIEYVNSSAGGS